MWGTKWLPANVPRNHRLEAYATCFPLSPWLVQLHAWSQSKLPIVEMAGDRITVRWHGEPNESTVEACHFRRGRAWQMKYASRKAGGLFFGDRELILIDLPPLHRDNSGNARAYTTVAVGYTPESMAAWTDALGQGDEPSDATESASQAF